MTRLFYFIDNFQSTDLLVHIEARNTLSNLIRVQDKNITFQVSFLCKVILMFFPTSSFLLCKA